MSRRWPSMKHVPSSLVRRGQCEFDWHPPSPGSTHFYPRLVTADQLLDLGLSLCQAISLRANHAQYYQAKLTGALFESFTAPEEICQPLNEIV